MIIVAKQSYIRSGQQKLRDMVRTVKKLSVPEAQVQLEKLNREAARRLLETVKQAVANAKHNFGVDEADLVFDEILVQRGPHYKRFRAVSRGQGHAILKRTSHIVVKLKTIEKKKSEEVKPVAQVTEKIEETEVKPVKKTVTKAKTKTVQAKKEKASK